MTAILFDGFDHADLVHRWTNAGGQVIQTSTVRTGTRAMHMQSGVPVSLALTSTEEDDVMYIGFGFNSVSGTSSVPVTFSENFGSPHHVSLIRRADIRGWEIRRGAGPVSPTAGTVIVPAIPNVWFPESWHYVEFGAKIHDTTGWVELRQDGVTIARFDGDTRNGGTDGLIDMVSIGFNNGTGQYFVDDVYILNEQGSVNNSWLGDTRCFPLYPDGNGSSSPTAPTPLSGSDGNSTDNFLLVDEAGTPVTTDYVFSTTDGDQETYTFQDLPVTLGTIRGVEVRAHAAKDDTGTKQFRMITRRAGADDFGPDHVLAAVPLWQTHHDIHELDPHAGPGAWTITNVNATEWGVQVRA